MELRVYHHVCGLVDRFDHKLKFVMPSNRSSLLSERGSSIFNWFAEAGNCKRAIIGCFPENIGSFLRLTCERKFVRPK